MNPDHGGFTRAGLSECRKPQPDRPPSSLAKHHRQAPCPHRNLETADILDPAITSPGNRWGRSPPLRARKTASHTFVSRESNPAGQ